MSATTTSARLVAPVDIASLVAFRILFGALMVVGVVRYFAYGWIHAYFIAPKLFFPYHGLGFVRPLPGAWMYVLFAVMGVAAAGIALGLFYRLSAALFCLTFTWAHLIDRTYYLNHYYLVSLVSLILVFAPLHGALSVDSWRRPALRSETAPAWALWALRFQVGLVYLFGGIAKLKPEWLLAAEPMRFWLRANSEFPVIGRLFELPLVPHAFSWAGAAYDLSVPFLMLARRTRPYAYLAVIAFHLITARLFQLGMFPWIMIAASLIFFDPDWPRRVLRLPARKPAPPGARTITGLQRLGLALLGVHALVQLAIPLRGHLYPGRLLWHEQGFRFSWNVMLMEKTGKADFFVTDLASGLRRKVDLHAWLTDYQIKMVSTQPDMIVAFARHLRADEALKGRDVVVNVDAFASLNGRAPARLVDPAADLGRADDGLAPKEWILPAPR